MQQHRPIHKPNQIQNAYPQANQEQGRPGPMRTSALSGLLGLGLGKRTSGLWREEGGFGHILGSSSWAIGLWAWCLA
jgi:hypothetical protein